MKNYELLEHTADLGIRVWGKDLKQLFINAASAMYELIADISEIKHDTAVDVELEAQDADELLRNWLSELLSCFHIKEMLLSEFLIEELNEKKIVSVAKGEKIDTKRHSLKREIKAVTFHNLKISQENGKFTTEIIFDV
ncbi:MAG: archease [Candidatus Omnitrophica bacterium]|nr:archease [Candidatus Omnitrophota bacterium]